MKRTDKLKRGYFLQTVRETQRAARKDKRERSKARNKHVKLI